MSFPLQKLLQVRESREKRASRTVEQRRQTLNQATQAVAAAKTRLEQQQANHRERKATLEATLLGQQLSPHHLHDWQADLKWMRQQQDELSEALQQTREVVTQRQTELAEARKAEQLARRAKEKIETRRKHWQTEEAKQRSHAEEQEIEDLILPGKRK